MVHGLGFGRKDVDLDVSAPPRRPNSKGDKWGPNGYLKDLILDST